MLPRRETESARSVGDTVKLPRGSQGERDPSPAVAPYFAILLHSVDWNEQVGDHRDLHYGEPTRGEERDKGGPLPTVQVGSCDVVGTVPMQLDLTDGETKYSGCLIPTLATYGDVPLSYVISRRPNRSPRRQAKQSYSAPPIGHRALPFGFR